MQQGSRSYAASASDMRAGLPGAAYMIVLQLIEDACHLRSALTQEPIKVFILLWVMEAVRESLDVGDHGAAAA